MKYKTSIKENIRLKTDIIQKKFGNDVRIKISSSNRRKPYSNKEIEMIIKLKKNGATDQEIADRIGRTYWSVVYKISDLRRDGSL